MKYFKEKIGPKIWLMKLKRLTIYQTDTSRTGLYLTAAVKSLSSLVNSLTTAFKSTFETLVSVWAQSYWNEAQTHLYSSSDLFDCSSETNRRYETNIDRFGKIFAIKKLYRSCGEKFDPLIQIMWLLEPNEFTAAVNSQFEMSGTKFDWDE
jgi:hypothetical protein